MSMTVGVGVERSLRNTETSIIRGTYYPHIDGLRAFAVLSVLIYHAFPSLCPGGFIGVDVFFVISGYLITKGLLLDLEKGTYSIGNFYVRRIRRIFPAYITVIIFSLIVGCILYTGEKLEVLANTACSSALFVTNIYFDKTIDYFAPGAHTNALLNLWSLSVEEQFYVFFPLLLAALYKWAPKYLKVSIWLTAIISLATCVYAVNIVHNEQCAFYWLPYRAWELMAGALLAIQLRNRFVNLKIGLVALLLLMFSFFWVSDAMSFPGIVAVLPVGCAVILLMSGNYGMVKGIMEHSSTVFIGKISYSLYLFHWPLLVFCRYALYGVLNPAWIGLIAVVLSFAFSIFSWRYIELPLRRTKWKNMRYYALGGGIIAIALASSLMSRVIAHNKSNYSDIVVEDYWNGEAADETDYPDPQWAESENATPNSLTKLGEGKNPQYVLWGDSHAMALSPGFHEFSLQTGINGLYVNRKHTLLENTYSKTYPDNAEWIESVLTWLERRPELHTVVLVNRWAVRSQGLINESNQIVNYIRCDGQGTNIQEVFEIGITRLCSRLKQMGKNVIILSSIPEQIMDGPEKLHLQRVFKGIIENNSTTASEYAERQREATAVFEDLEQKKLAHVLWVAPAFFKDGEPVSLMLPNNVSMYKDDDHLTPSGAKYLLEHIKKSLKDAILLGAK